MVEVNLNKKGGVMFKKILLLGGMAVLSLPVTAGFIIEPEGYTIRMSEAAVFSLVMPNSIELLKENSGDPGFYLSIIGEVCHFVVEENNKKGLQMGVNNPSVERMDHSGTNVLFAGKNVNGEKEYRFICKTRLVDGNDYPVQGKMFAETYYIK